MKVATAGADKPHPIVNPEVAQLMRYLFYNLNDDLDCATTKITDAEAMALVEKAQEYNEKLYAEKSKETIFKDDMESFKEIEQNNAKHSMRFFKMRAKESGAFMMRLDQYVMEEMDKGLTEAEKEKTLDNALFVKMGTRELHFLFAKYYSHWFGNGN